MSLSRIVQNIFGVTFKDTDNPSEQELQSIRELSEKLPPYASIILCLREYLNITTHCSWSEIKSCLLDRAIFTFNICIEAKKKIKQKDEEIARLQNEIHSLRLENADLNKCIIVMQILDSSVQCAEALFSLEDCEETPKKRKLV